MTHTAPNDSLTPEEARDAELLAAAFDPRFAAELQDEQALSAPIEELRALRSTWRAALVDGGASELSSQASRASDALQASRVAQRVLERTTREDLRRRADLGLVLDFVSDRLRDSLILRVVAAALLVQITVVPLVALHLLRERQPTGLNVDFEPSAAELAEELKDDLPEPPLDVVGGSSAGVVDALVGDLFDAELSGNAVDLAERAAGIDRTVRPSTGLGRALEALTRVASVDAAQAGSPGNAELLRTLDELGAGRVAVGGAVRGAAADATGGDALLEATLAAEARLFAVDQGLEWRGVGIALERFVSEFAQVDSQQDPRMGALGRRALAHALRAGIGLPASAESLGEAMTRPLFDGDPRLDTAWGTAWIDTLEAALRRSGASADDAYVAAWLAAGVRAR